MSLAMQQQQQHSTEEAPSSLYLKFELNRLVLQLHGTADNDDDDDGVLYENE